MTRLFAGFAAGLIATIPMTATMVLIHRKLPRKEREPLPPYQVTKDLTRKTGMDRWMDEKDKRALTVASHFAYGAGAGGLYGLASDLMPAPPLLGGVAYGLAIWGGSYIGWLPAMNIYKEPEQEPPRRIAMMIAAHLVWGATLGVVLNLLSPPKGRR
jgi:uncharacterized membrane protein YagU involved in acid resistance